MASAAKKHLPAGDGRLKAIDKDSVHRICSGQVVLTLGVAVKELIENSIDAGATALDIRLKEYGLEMLEVSDNGSGIHPDNFEALALKHHTSKLKEFTDLESMATFGFRGEALSSLCALGNLQVITSSSDNGAGHRLVFNNGGELAHQADCARQRGTTVSVESLFSTLPVRHQEFKRNLKREYGKMVQLLHGYCMARPDVKFNCLNSTAKSRMNVLRTRGDGDLRNTVVTLFGPKLAQTLIEFKQSAVPSTEESMDTEDEEAAMSQTPSSSDDASLAAAKQPSVAQRTVGSITALDRFAKGVPDPPTLPTNKRAAPDNDSNITPVHVKRAGGIDAGLRVTGFISKPSHGTGRASSDKQFFAINDRPCDLPKVARAINEVYHQYNRHQYPFFFLNITIPKADVDINVTPDKRTIFIQQEKAVIELITKSLHAMYEPFKAQYSVNSKLEKLETLPSSQSNVSASASRTKRTVSISLDMFAAKSSSSSSRASGPKRSQPSIVSAFGRTAFATPTSKEQASSQDSQASASAESDPSSDVYSFPQPTELTPTSSADKSVQDAIDKEPRRKGSSQLQAEDESADDRSETAQTIEQPQDKAFERPPSDNADDSISHEDNEGVSGVSGISGGRPYPVISTADVIWCCRARGCSRFMVDLGSRMNVQAHYGSKHRHRTYPGPRVISAEPSDDLSERQSSEQEQTRPPNENASQESRNRALSSQFTDSDVSETQQTSSEAACRQQPDDHDQMDVDVPARTGEATPASERPEDHDANREDIVAQSWASSARLFPTSVTVSMPSLDVLQAGGDSDDPADEDRAGHRRHFAAKISPQANQAAEEELSRNITQGDFLRMKIIGQFNHGFIIARLDDDLFIVDQHATDEKYNFERLKRDTVLRCQPLISAKKLELPAVQEEVVMDHLEVFEKNGFKLSVDPDEPPMKRVKLVAVPYSKDTRFGEGDIDEMVALLSDQPGKFCRPSRVTAMFASRACRSSVMIGKALSKAEMRRIVAHMSEMEHPWNCPHGRPTMRHLVCLKDVNNVH